MLYQHYLKEKAPEFTSYLEKQQVHLGTGGYMTAMPKWDNAEADMRTAGSKPTTDGWPMRVRS
jgi:hypothetical protein